MLQIAAMAVEFLGLHSRDQVHGAAVFFAKNLQIGPACASLGATQLYKVLLLLHIGSPGELDLQASAVVKADKAHGQIFHIEGTVLHLVAELRVDRVRHIGISELAEGAARYRHGSGVTHKPHSQVDHMHAQVDQRTAAGLSLGGEPAALAGNTPAALPATATGVNLAHLAIFDKLLQELSLGRIAVISHNHQHPVIGLCGSLHFQCFFHIDCIGFLAEDMQALVQRLHRNDGVQVVGGADIHRIQAGDLQHLTVVRISLCIGGMLFYPVFRAAGNNITNCNNINFRNVLIGQQMVGTHAAAADQGDLFLGHF